MFKSDYNKMLVPLATTLIEKSKVAVKVFTWVFINRKIEQTKLIFYEFYKTPSIHLCNLFVQILLFLILYNDLWTHL